MQGIISSSSERVSRVISPVANTVKVKKYTDSIMITLCQDTNNNRYYFTKTELGFNTIKCAELPYGFEIYDFTIYGTEIFFCGKRVNQTIIAGFIAWTTYNNLFSGGSFRYDLIQPTKIIYELDVFRNDTLGTVNIVALGTNDLVGGSTAGIYFFIDYQLNSNTYNLYYTQNYVLHTLTQTPTTVDVVFSGNNNSYLNQFGVMRHMKSNMLNSQSQIWQYAYNGFDYTSGDSKPQKRKPCFLAKKLGDTERICVTTAIQADTTYSMVTNHKINTFIIDIPSLQLLYTQVIPTQGKPKLKDMEYSDGHQILHILANTTLDSIFNGCTNGLGCVDVIYELRPLIPPTTSYTSSVIVPENNIFLEVLNGIAIYSDRYYTVAGKSTSTSTLYWFDRRFITTQNICYDRYTFNAHFEPTNPMGNMTYGIITCSKNVYSGNFTQYSTIYSTTCLD